MKTVYVFFADGFELIEAFSPIDVLSRCGAKVVAVSINDNLEVKSSQGMKVITDKLLKDVNCLDADALVIPGGYPGYVNLRENKDVVKIVENHLTSDKIVAAICGGPTIFSFNNLAKNKTLTAHSSTKDDFKKYNYSGKNIEKDGNLLTAIGAGHSLEFAFLIAKELFDEEIIEKVKKGMEIK